MRQWRRKEFLDWHDYEILDYHDGNLKNSKEIQKIVADRIEKWKADVVILYYPVTSEAGGHNDNMQAGLIVKDAAAMVKHGKISRFPVYAGLFYNQFLTHS